MSGSASAFPSDEIQNVHIPGPPRSRFAKRYLEITNDAERAERLDQCGRWQDFRDKNKHKKRQHYHCMSGFCRNCVGNRFRALSKEYKDILASIHASGDYSTVTFLEVSLPRPRRDRDDSEYHFGHFTDVIFSQTELYGRETPCWCYLPGYKDNNLIMRAVIANPSGQPEITNAEWNTHFHPSATVTVHTRHISNLSRLFHQSLLSIDCLSDDAFDRAEQDALFLNMKRWRRYDIPSLFEDVPTSYTCEEDMFADTIVLANMSFEARQKLGDTIISAVHPSRDICAHCGEPFDEQSQFFPPDAPEPAEKDYRWYRKNH